MNFFQQFIAGLVQTSWVEFVAVVAGIVSVYFSRKESIWVYPIGLVNTTLYIYLSMVGHLYGEASVNFYYTGMSIYGWVLWSRKNQQQEPVIKISTSSRRQWFFQIGFFAVCYLVLFVALSGIKASFAPGAIPWADAFASATAYTGMWLMARKKVESWYWWILTNMASIPLYYSKGYAFTAVQFSVLLVMAFMGLVEWRRRAQ